MDSIHHFLLRDGVRMPAPRPETAGRLRRMSLFIGCHCCSRESEGRDCGVIAGTGGLCIPPTLIINGIAAFRERRIERAMSLPVGDPLAEVLSR